MQRQKKKLLKLEKKKSTTKKQEKKLLRKEGKNRHHRLPKSLGGTNKNGNVTIVRIIEHRAYHLLFGRLTAPLVARTLNDSWLPLDSIVISLPTNRVSEALALLFQAGIIPTVSPENHGVSEDHLRYHGNEAEKKLRQIVYLNAKRRPE